MRSEPDRSEWTAAQEDSCHKSGHGDLVGFCTWCRDSICLIHIERASFEKGNIFTGSGK